MGWGGFGWGWAAGRSEIGLVGAGRRSEVKWGWLGRGGIGQSGAWRGHCGVARRGVAEWDGVGQGAARFVWSWLWRGGAGRGVMAVGLARLDESYFGWGPWGGPDMVDWGEAERGGAGSGLDLAGRGRAGLGGAAEVGRGGMGWLGRGWAGWNGLGATLRILMAAPLRTAHSNRDSPRCFLPRCLPSEVSPSLYAGARRPDSVARSPALRPPPPPALPGPNPPSLSHHFLQFPINFLLQRVLLSLFSQIFLLCLALLCLSFSACLSLNPSVQSDTRIRVRCRQTSRLGITGTGPSASQSGLHQLWQA